MFTAKHEHCKNSYWISHSWWYVVYSGWGMCSGWNSREYTVSPVHGMLWSCAATVDSKTRNEDCKIVCSSCSSAWSSLCNRLVCFSFFFFNGLLLPYTHSIFFFFFFFLASFFFFFFWAFFPHLFVFYYDYNKISNFKITRKRKKKQQLTGNQSVFWKECVCIPILVTTFPEWLSGT